MKLTTFTTAALLACVSGAVAHGEPDVKHEHAGDVFTKVHGGNWWGDGVINNGTPTGETVQLGGGRKRSPLAVLKRVLTWIREPIPFLPEEESDRIFSFIPDRHLW